MHLDLILLFCISFELLLAPLLCISQLVSEENSLNYYGEKVSSKSLSDLSQIDEGSLIKVQGTVLSSCPKKGCWVKIITNSEEIFVTFKDYSFFVPIKGIEGKDILINGLIKLDTISVSQLKHYAYDAGESEDFISKIKQPKITKSIVAEGVAIVD